MKNACVMNFFLTLLAAFVLQGQRNTDVPLGAATGNSSYPAVQLSNKFTQLPVYIPDAVNGYYRGCRFDWSGIVFRMTALGHTFFGEWKEKRHPESRDPRGLERASGEGRLGVDGQRFPDICIEPRGYTVFSTGRTVAVIAFRNYH